MVENTSYQQQQRLGELFMKAQVLWKVKEMFEGYKTAKLEDASHKGIGHPDILSNDFDIIL